MNDKYKMFKNFMFNELGITKDDIRSWVMEAVTEEARRVVAKTYCDFDVEKALREAITSPYSPIRSDMVKKATQLLFDKFELIINEKK